MDNNGTYEINNAPNFTQVNFNIWCYRGKKTDYTYQQYSPHFDTVSHSAKMGSDVLVIGNEPRKVSSFGEALNIVIEMEKT